MKKHQKMNRKDQRLADMNVGDSGWGVPWSLRKTRTEWVILEDHTIEETQGGTSQLFVWRDEDGWHADCHDVNWDFEVDLLVPFVLSDQSDPFVLSGLLVPSAQ